MFDKIGKATIISLSALTMLISGRARSQSVDDMPEVERYFDGFYIGAEFGASRVKMDLPQSAFAQQLPSVKDTGISYGGGFGWRHQTPGNLVIGLEGRFSDVNASNRFTIQTESGPRESLFTAGRQLGLEAIFGYAFGASRRTMIYASIGYQNQKFKVNPLMDGSIFEDSQGGIRLGGGFEYRLTDRFHVRLSGHGGATLSEFSFGSTINPSIRSNIQILAGALFVF